MYVRTLSKHNAYDRTCALHNIAGWLNGWDSTAVNTFRLYHV